MMCAGMASASCQGLSGSSWSTFSFARTVAAETLDAPLVTVVAAAIATASLSWAFCSVLLGAERVVNQPDTSPRALRPADSRLVRAGPRALTAARTHGRIVARKPHRTRGHG